VQLIGNIEAKPISIGFVGFHSSFNHVWNNITMSLTHRFQLKVSEPVPSPTDRDYLDIIPDILFFSVYEKPHLNSRYRKCLKIFTCEENIRPPWNECAFAMTGDYDDSPRHLRLPIYVRVLRHLKDQKCVREGLLPKANPTLVKDPTTDWSSVASSKTKFCNFVFSNPNARERLRLFELLSKYRRVDAGGPLRNNIGYRVKEKLPFISDYKFTIAYENSTFPGYVSEKLVEPMIVSSLPIYWGSPCVQDDFNPESFVWANGRSVDDVVAEIVALDRSPDKYAAKLATPWFASNLPNRYCSPDHVADFFQKIVETAT